jgi:hypothetical protein
MQWQQPPEHPSPCFAKQTLSLHIRISLRGALCATGNSMGVGPSEYKLRMFSVMSARLVWSLIHVLIQPNTCQTRGCRRSARHQYECAGSRQSSGRTEAHRNAPRNFAGRNFRALHRKVIDFAIQTSSFVLQSSSNRVFPILFWCFGLRFEFFWM